MANLIGIIASFIIIWTQFKSSIQQFWQQNRPTSSCWADQVIHAEICRYFWKEFLIRNSNRIYRKISSQSGFLSALNTILKLDMSACTYELCRLSGIYHRRPTLLGTIQLHSQLVVFPNIHYDSHLQKIKRTPSRSAELWCLISNSSVVVQRHNGQLQSCLAFRAYLKKGEIYTWRWHYAWFDNI